MNIVAFSCPCSSWQFQPSFFTPTIWCSFLFLKAGEWPFCNQPFHINTWNCHLWQLDNSAAPQVGVWNCRILSRHIHIIFWLIKSECPTKIYKIEESGTNEGDEEAEEGVRKRREVSSGTIFQWHDLAQNDKSKLWGCLAFRSAPIHTIIKWGEMSALIYQILVERPSVTCTISRSHFLTLNFISSLPLST